MNARARVFVLALIAAVTIGAQGAAAESLLKKNFHYFQPPADGSGVIFTHGSEALNWVGIHYGVWSDWSFEHLTVILDNDEEENLIEHQVGASALFSIGVSRFVNIGLAIPFVPYREFNSEYKPTETQKTEIEDPRLEVKGILFDRRRHCIGLALAATASYPYTMKENTFLSDEGFSITPRLIFDIGRRWWTVALNGAYRHGPASDSPYLDNDVRDEVLINGGVKFRPAYSHELMVDVQTRSPISKFYSDPEANYGEAVVAYRYLWGSYSTYALTIGGGGGFLDGVGTPTVRVFIGFTSFEHRAEPGW